MIISPFAAFLLIEMTDLPTLSDTSVNLGNPYPFISLKPRKRNPFQAEPPCISH